MTLLDKILQLPEEKLAPILKRLREMNDNREKFYKKYRPSLYGDFSKNLKKEDGWTKERTMKKTFSVPLEVYMADPVYWDRVCKSRELQKKHPEWQIGESKNKKYI